MSVPSPAFRARIRQGLSDAVLQEALQRATRSFQISREKAFADLPDAEAVRDRARAIRALSLIHI